MRARPSCVLIALLAAAVSPAAAGGLPPVPVPPENPITEPKRVLGKILFWDVQLSSDSTVACGTCHLPTSGGADARLATHPGFDGTFGTDDDVLGSPGVVRRDASGNHEPDPLFGFGPQVTRRAANSAILAQFDPEIFWDGRAAGTFVDPEGGATLIPTGAALESQAVAPIVSDVEMARPGRTWTQVTDKLAAARPLAVATDLPADVAAAIAADPTYGDLFDAAFGTPAITADRIAFAIATYERTLVPDQTPFDLGTLTPIQNLGFDDFMGAQARCADCHPPPLFTDGSFRNIGLRPPAEDTGRQEVTGLLEDRGKFKVTPLRVVGLKPTFMHNGAHESLAEVMDFYREVNGQVQFTDNIDPLVPLISVTSSKATRIANFMAEALTDPRAEAGTFPFDRPTLHTELPPNPSALGAGRAGTGGVVPQLLVDAPPNIGNADFSVGVANGLAGATAHLAWSSRQPAVDGVLPPEQLVGPFTLGSAGHATWFAPIPDDAALLGNDVYVQWRVDDPGAAGGVALSPVARISYFLDDPVQCAGCPGDVDCNRAIDVDDLVAIILAFGAGPGEADLDASGAVDVDDVIAAILAWGSCP